MRFLLGLIFCIYAYGAVLTPVESIEAGGNVIDMSLYGDKLIAGTDAGSLEVYNTQNSQKIFEAKFEKIKDFMGDTISPKIFSVDYDEKNETYLAVVQASNGSRELVLIKGDTQTKLIDMNKKLYISKAKFVLGDKILLALLSNELILLDTKSVKQIYRFQINFSHFSDLKISEDKRFALNGCESGDLSYIDIQNGNVMKILKGANLDNTYKVDIKNGYALGAGQDRKGSVYNIKTGKYITFEAPFLIYAGALSPSAKLAAYAFTQENDIVVFDVEKEKELYTLKGQKSTLNTILFKGEKELFSGSDDRFIQRWRLP